MTAQEIIEKIRAEIERQREEIRPTDTGEMKVVGTPTQLEQGWLNALSWMEKVLDTLQEQPVKIDIRKELASIEFMGVNDARDSETIARHFYELGRQSKPKVSDGLEEEIERYLSTEWELDKDLNKDEPIYIYDCTWEDLKILARHFAQWGAEHRGSSEIPNDLESYAQKVEDHYDVGEERGYLCVHRGEVKDAVIAGASWQKEKDDKELSEKIASAYQLGLADKEKQMVKEAEKPCHTVEEWMEHIKNADQLTKDIFSKGPYNVLYDALNHPYRDCYDAIKEFGELCYQTARQDMMKEAVEGEVIKTDKHTSVRYKSFYGTYRYFYGIADKQFKPGDKGHIIFVKED